MVRAHAPGVDGAGAAHAEHRRRVAGPARLQVADQLFQLLAHQAQGQLQIDALRGDQVVGAKKLARRAEKRNTKRLVAIAPDGEARGHGVPAVLLEQRRHALQHGVQVEPHHAPPGAPPHLPVPRDQEGGPPVALHQARRHNADDAGVPLVRREHQPAVGGGERRVGGGHRLVENALIERLAARVQRLQVAPSGRPRRESR